LEKKKKEEKRKLQSLAELLHELADILFNFLYVMYSHLTKTVDDH